MDYGQYEEIIIAVLDLTLSVLKGAKKLRALLIKRKKSQASTSATKDTDIEISSEPSEGEA